jgi:hypothetical protein
MLCIELVKRRTGVERAVAERTESMPLGEDDRERHDPVLEPVEHDVLAELAVVRIGGLDRDNSRRGVGDLRRDERIHADVRSDVVEDIARAEAAFNPCNRPRLLRDRKKATRRDLLRGDPYIDRRGSVIEARTPASEEAAAPRGPVSAR